MLLFTEFHFCQKKNQIEGMEILSSRLTMKQLYHCSYLVKFLSDRNSTIIWQNPIVFPFGEFLLFKDLRFIMQKSSEPLCQVQVFTCWVRSYWVKRIHILFHSSHNFLVSGKSAWHYLVKEHLILASGLWI